MGFVTLKICRFATLRGTTLIWYRFTKLFEPRCFRIEATFKKPSQFYMNV